MAQKKYLPVLILQKAESEGTGPIRSQYFSLPWERSKRKKVPFSKGKNICLVNSLEVGYEQAIRERHSITYGPFYYMLLLQSLCSKGLGMRKQIQFCMELYSWVTFGQRFLCTLMTSPCLCSIVQTNPKYSRHLQGMRRFRGPNQFWKE